MWNFPTKFTTKFPTKPWVILEMRRYNCDRQLAVALLATHKDLG